MHRLILNTPKGINSDHRDGNTLNCQRDNLRLDTEKRNNQNRGMQSNNTSGYKGVYWNKQAKKWMARIRFQGKLYYLGLFNIAKEGAKRYNIEALKLHGEFAKLNLIK